MEQKRKIKDFGLLSETLGAVDFDSQGEFFCSSGTWANRILVDFNFEKRIITTKIQEGLDYAGKECSYDIKKDKYEKLSEKTRKKIKNIFGKSIKEQATVYEVLEKDVD